MPAYTPCATISQVKNWKDLLSDTPFTRKDIIQLQDPTDLEKFNLTKFHHLKKGLKVKDDVSDAEKLKPSYTLRNANAEASSTMVRCRMLRWTPVWCLYMGDGLCHKCT